MSRPRALFFGTPEIAIPSLEALHRLADVVRVFAQPDRPSGRGHELKAPPVKVRALELGLAVEQPTKLRPPEFAEQLRALEADLAVVIAYGRILPKAVLEAPRRGCVNLHASLLPLYRGAAPLQWALLDGRSETGVCLMEMDEGLDTGPVVACAKTALGPSETSGELFERMGPFAAELLTRELLPWLAGERRAVPQHGEPSHARMLTKADAILDFARPARRVHDWVRGLTPWPGAETMCLGQRVKVHRTRVADEGGLLATPGTLLAVEPSGLRIACSEGAIVVVEAQLDGKKRVPAHELARGLRLEVGAVFGGVTSSRG